MSELNLETVMLIEEFINEAKAMKADRDRLAAELADCQAVNHAVAVCRDHTKEITSFDGCLICDRDRLAARVRELENLVNFWTDAAHDRDRLETQVRELEGQLRKIAAGEDPGRPVPPHGSGP